uniref:Uncharacterized protein n=1 Tax=Phytophthora ramorum TaxID=164328 RepID=H3GV92_PHYRM
MTRRETRSEAEAFLARLEGRSVGERQRLTAEHRSYLAGERANDAEFGADEPRAPTRSGPAGVARAAPSARRPPMGKTAAYLAALQKRKEEVEAEEPSEQSQGGKGGRAKGKRPDSTKRKKAAGPKKLTAREEKAAQEAVAVSRAAAQASKKSLERKKERLRLEKEEKRGADARAAALARLEKKKEKAATDKATKKGKRSKKTAASSTQETEDKSARSRCRCRRRESKSDEEVPSVPAQAPVGPVPSPQTRTTSRDPVVAEPASELSEVPVVTAVSVAAPMDASPTLEVTAQTRNTARALDLDEPDSASPGDLTDVSARLSCAVDASVGMDSDVEGESSDSESWYFTHDFNDIAAVEEEDDDQEEVEEEEEEEGDSDTLEESGRDGVAIMARRRKNEAKRLARKHLKEAVEKLPRDWGKTTSNWDLLTAAEQAVLAQDTNALKEMRVTGWNLDPEMFPDDTEYPGIYDGEYGPTAEVLERATSPLDLLFFFMPRSLWTHIAKESNRYYDQHLNERVDEMHRKQREQDKDVTRDEVLEKEIKQHKPIKGHEIMRPTT